MWFSRRVSWGLSLVGLVAVGLCARPVVAATAGGPSGTFSAVKFTGLACSYCLCRRHRTGSDGNQ